MMRWWILWPALAYGCMPGYYGDSCTLCPSGYVCDGSGSIERCATAPMNGSAFCPYGLVCWTSQATRSRIPLVRSNVSNSSSYEYKNTTCGCARGPIVSTLDFGRVWQIGGLAMQGLNGWVNSFFIEYYDKAWIRLGGLYEWDSYWPTSAHNVVFLYAVQTQFLRLTVMDYVSEFTYPRLLVAALDDPCCPAMPGQNCTIVNQMPVTKSCANCGCSPGYYTIDGAECLLCPTGYVCADGAMTECDVGNVCPVGSAVMSPCT